MHEKRRANATQTWLSKRMLYGSITQSKVEQRSKADLGTNFDIAWRSDSSIEEQDSFNGQVSLSPSLTPSSIVWQNNTHSSLHQPTAWSIMNRFEATDVEKNSYKMIATSGDRAMMQNATTIGNNHTKIQIPTSIVTREDSYTNLFFSYFCGEWSILAGQQFWKATIPMLMQQSPGIKSTVLAVSAMFAHRSYANLEAGSDSLVYYSNGVRSVQQSLDSHVSGLSDTMTLVGVTLLMVFELLSGNVSGYHVHLDALSLLVLGSGPINCRQGMHSLVLLTMAIANINRALLHGSDTFLASAEWIETLYSILPARFALVVSAYARAARCVHHQRSFELGALIANEVTYAENWAATYKVLDDLQGIYDGYTLLGFPMEAENSHLYPLLSTSPFSPSMVLPNLRMSANFPMLVAVMLHVRDAFSLQAQDDLLLANQMVQVAQYIIVSNHDSATLLGQVWTLIIARRFLRKESQLEWFATLDRLIFAKGFGVARS